MRAAYASVDIAVPTFATEIVWHSFLTEVRFRVSLRGCNNIIPYESGSLAGLTVKAVARSGRCEIVMLKF